MQPSTAGRDTSKGSAGHAVRVSPTANMHVGCSFYVRAKFAIHTFDGPLLRRLVGRRYALHSAPRKAGA